MRAFCRTELTRINGRDLFWPLWQNPATKIRHPVPLVRTCSLKENLQFEVAAKFDMRLATVLTLFNTQHCLQ